MKRDGLSLREKLGYAAGDTASVLYFHTFSQFLMYFYTDVFGILAASVGTLFLVTRLFDALNDPIMGMLADRTRSRHGKFRPWLLWGIGPYVVFGILTFTVPALPRDGRLIYAYVTYIAVGMVYTMINIPYGALMGVITDRSEERTVLAAFRFYGAYLAVFFVNLTLLKLVGFLGRGSQADGFQRTMSLYAILAAGLFYLTFKTTRERVKPLVDQGSNVKQDLRQLLSNRPWLAICGVGILTLVWISLRNAAVMYFMKYYVKANEDVTTWFLTLGTLGVLLGVAFTKPAVRWCGSKKRAYIVMTLASSLVGLGFTLVDAHRLWLLFALHMGWQLLMGPLMPLFWSMIADTADYAEWRDGSRLTGLVFSAGTFSQKTGWALGSAIGGWFLAWYGYRPNAVQTAEAIDGIKQLMGLLPSVIGILSAIMVVFYGIDRKLALEMEEELRVRRARAG